MGRTAFPTGSQALSSRVLAGAHLLGEGPLDTQTGTPKSQRGPPPPTRPPPGGPGAAGRGRVFQT